MLTRIHRLGRDERGISIIFVSIGITAFVAATTLAVDVGMLMNARTQAQTSADAGALAGATALAFNDFSNRSSSGPAVQSAMNAALANQVVGAPVSILASDVTFPTSPTGTNDRIQVNVFRTAERGDPVATMIARVFGVNSADIKATAVAEAVLANSESCVKPWALPDKWTEKQTPGWDVTDTFNAFTGSPSILPDQFRQVTQTSYTGYGPGQIGMPMQIAKDDAFTLEADRFLSIRMPGSLGDDDFLANIENCNSSKLTLGDSMTIEGGATAQHIIDGANYLIGLDSSASWNTATHTVVSSHNPSPRVIVMPLYEPLYFQQGVRTGNYTQVRISNFIGFFIDHVEASKVVGYVMPTLGTAPTNGTAAPVGAFARAVRLVQ